LGDQPIGSGSYGTVWLAKTLMGTYRAIKVVYRSTFDQAHPFEREFKGIRNYEPLSRTHPGLVQILQVGLNETDGYFYYVMEVADDDLAGQSIDHQNYLPRNLRNVLNRGALPLADSVDLGLALADAVRYLHQHHLIHRDIKPANIIFVNGSPKLADIGLVTEMQSNAGNATWIGTEGYIPPEGPGTALADVYSLGKVIYEASTGLDRSQFPELSSRVQWNSDPQAYQALNEIILTACERDPKNRYSTAADLHNALAKLRHQLAKQ
jgi:serine/threonine protein kinase